MIEALGGALISTLRISACSAPLRFILFLRFPSPQRRRGTQEIRREDSKVGHHQALQGDGRLREPNFPDSDPTHPITRIGPTLVQTPRDADDTHRMTFEYTQASSAIDIPQPDCAVV